MISSLIIKLIINLILHKIKSLKQDNPTVLMKILKENN